MDIAQQLIANFPNSVNKNSKNFGDIVANENHNGVMETILTNAKNNSQSWYDTPDIYEQSGELFDLSAEFFTYFQRYTDEPLDAYKERIRTIFQRNGDKVWGSPYDIKSVFESFFNSAQVFIAENVASLSESLLVDGDFQQESDAWEGIDNDLESNCHLARYARFSLGKGVELHKNGSFSQTIENDTDPDDYTVVTGDTYASLSNKNYGTKDLELYIHDFGNNPDKINGPVKGTTNVIFSRKTSLNEITVIPAGTIVKSGDKEFKTIAETQIGADSDAKKAKVTLRFNADHTIGEGEIAIIESGMIISDSNNHKFQTLDEVSFTPGASYVTVDAEALENGTDYNLAANTITTLVATDKLSENITSVTNPLPANGGENGTNLNSDPVIVQAGSQGPDYNVGANTINEFENLPADIISVTNPQAVTNGANASQIQIPALNTYNLHFFMAGKCGVKIIDDRGKYWNPKISYDRTSEIWTMGKWQDEEFTINKSCHYEYDAQGNIKPTSSANKSVVSVKFFTGGARAINDGINIPDGTIISDGTNKFRTLFGTSIKRDETESALVEAECINGGTKGNVDAETITIVEDEIEGVSGCINPAKARGGTDCGWENQEIFFVCDKDISEVKIQIDGVEDFTCLDYFRLFKKEKHPSFSVIAHFSSSSDSDAAALFTGNADKPSEITEKRYENASYFDNDYISGIVNTGYATEIYEDLLNYLRAAGVKAYIEIVSRDE